MQARTSAASPAMCLPGSLQHGDCLEDSAGIAGRGKEKNCAAKAGQACLGHRRAIRDSNKLTLHLIARHRAILDL